MDKPTLTELAAQPEFDLESFMNFASETRVASADLEKMLALWEDWRERLNIVQIQQGNGSWLAIWLPEDIETDIDKTWDESPSRGFLFNSLAQYLCMAAVEQLLPQAADGGCAPAPKPAPGLANALVILGLAQDGSLNLSRRYAILTYYPFRGGCEICAMRENCPKANGQANVASVVLPGYERGV